MTKAIFFDVDGVLLDSFVANFTFYKDLAITYGFPSPTEEEYRTMFNLPMVDVIRKVTKANEALVQQMFAAARSGKIPYRIDLMSAPEKIEDVLLALSARYQLGIVTSRIKGSLFLHPSLAPLEHCFQVQVYFEDTIHHKPHPEPLLYGATKIGVDPSEVIYVGDATTDIEAALAAGMKAILYSKRPLVEADAHTSSFTQIPKLIESIS